VISLMMNERRRAVWTLRGWAISVLQEAGAIRECEEHCWMRDRADPHSRERALVVASQDPPFCVSPGEAVVAVENVLDSIGDTCRSARPIAARLLPSWCYPNVVPERSQASCRQAMD
jgi:hypothetical protein